MADEKSVPADKPVELSYDQLEQADGGIKPEAHGASASATQLPGMHKKPDITLTRG